jgi:hypothetical protein
MDSDKPRALKGKQKNPVIPDVTKYKPEYCQRLIDYMSTGLAFDNFGCDIDVVRSTLYQWKLDHPEFDLAYQKGKEFRFRKDERMLEGLIDGSIKGNAAALMFKFKAFHRITDDVVGMEKLRLLKLEGMSDADIKELARDFLKEKSK